MKPLVAVTGALKGFGYIAILPFTGVFAILLLGAQKLALVLKPLLK